jgi:hypothetical protein
MAQPTWALGFGDEVWWIRLAPPNQHGWTAAEATDKWQALSPATDDPDPKVLACYGLLVRPQPQAADQLWCRCVTGRPQAEVARPVHRRHLQEHDVGVDVLGEELWHGAEGSRHVEDRLGAVFAALGVESAFERLDEGRVGFNHVHQVVLEQRVAHGRR